MTQVPGPPPFVQDPVCTPFSPPTSQSKQALKCVVWRVWCGVVCAEDSLDPHCRSSSQLEGECPSQHDPACCLCHREFAANDRGAALLCRGCSCAMHAACLRLPRPPDPAKPWFCPVCRDGHTPR